ncbi:hypothetical protein HYALB_00013992 [Hymenoscyphus albidus]|uniref:FAD-binding domain-containing protein n=1 Tax=Hymenoscyphus albidus TaxID=595503 RepID=A0A9N9LVA3_9HELO|nr:hypothetical protein HYALB_00013992 [Hymenoscyphus albidus]
MTRASPTDPVLIIGAGISGLALAQGLRLNSIPFRLFELRPRSHGSQGHRLRISPETVTALDSILLPQSKSLFYQTGAEKGAFQPRYVAAKEFVFPSPTPASHSQGIPIDRTWLRNLMMLGVDDAIEFEKELTSYEVIENDKVCVSFDDGSWATGCFLVAADGVRSRVRRQLQPHCRLLDLERWVIWGRTLLTESLRARLRDDQLTWFMAIDKEANVQVVLEPMVWKKSVTEASEYRLTDCHDYIYWALCTETAPGGLLLPKSARERKEFLLNITKHWHPDLQLIFNMASHDLLTCVTVLSSKPDIEIQSSSHRGKVTLLGDSAHVMSPMGGSGGNAAILNAVDLAQTINRYGISQKAMEGFEERMSQRAKEKIEHSFEGGKKFWKGGEWFQYQESEV